MKFVFLLILPLVQSLTFPCFFGREGEAFFDSSFPFIRIEFRIQENGKEIAAERIIMNPDTGKAKFDKIPEEPKKGLEIKKGDKIKKEEEMSPEEIEQLKHRMEAFKNKIDSAQDEEDNMYKLFGVGVVVFYVFLMCLATVSYVCYCIYRRRRTVTIEETKLITV